MGAGSANMVFELESLDPVPRTFEDDERDGEAELLQNSSKLVLEVTSAEPSSPADTMLLATTSAAACFLKAFAREATPVACLRFEQGCSHKCQIWRSSHHPELLFAHLEGAVPEDRSLEWADELLAAVDVRRVMVLHSMRPLECDRFDSRPMAVLQTDSFKVEQDSPMSMPSLCPPYTVPNEAAAMMTRCQVLGKSAAAFIAWQVEADYGVEVLAMWEPVIQLVTGSCAADLQQDYFREIKLHAKTADHYIYS